MALGPLPSIRLKIVNSSEGHAVLFCLGFCSIQKLSLFQRAGLKCANTPQTTPFFEAVEKFG